jgi:hypothetical protein
MKKINDKRLVLLEALIRYADQCGDSNPHFYKDEMLKMLNVCEHVFNIMQIQLGDGYCHMVDNLEERSNYAINVNRCLELRDQIIQANTRERRHREKMEITFLVTLIGTFFVIVIGNCIF